MLQTIRSKTAGVVVKVLFIVLVASFAVWGIGDYAFLRRGEEVAIRVGDAKITPEQLSIEYRREVDRLRRSFGQFDLEMAKQIGLINQVIERMVRDTLFEKEAARLGVVVSDDVVRARIAANPAFHGLGGGFDRNMFQRVLYENGYNEGQYVQLLRQELARAAVIESRRRWQPRPRRARRSPVSAPQRTARRRDDLHPQQLDRGCRRTGRRAAQIGL